MQSRAGRGPRQVYNAILRQHPADVFGRFRAGGNLYATAIHMLVSAVMRIARSTKLPSGLELFRGLGGLMALPESFFQVDANGCRGYAEWGFLSTTSNRAVAVEVWTLPAAARPQGCTWSPAAGADQNGVGRGCGGLGWGVWSSIRAWCRGGRRRWCCG